MNRKTFDSIVLWQQKENALERNALHASCNVISNALVISHHACFCDTFICNVAGSSLTHTIIYGRDANDLDLFSDQSDA